MKGIRLPLQICFWAAAFCMVALMARAEETSPLLRGSDQRNGVAAHSGLLRSHWAFQPIRAPLPPDVRDGKWVRDPIDRFVLAKLEQANLRPSPPADRRTLVRRAYFDLIGLPPTYEEIRAFETDDSPGARDVGSMRGPYAIFQSRIDPPVEPLSSRVPSGENATPTTAPS